MIVRSAAAAAVVLAGFQQPSAPPMKLGLWEQTTVVTLKAADGQLPPGVPTSQTVKARSCYTAETWSRMLANMPTKSCTVSNQSIMGTHMSIDVSCMQMAVKVHVDANFPTPETGHGTVHMEMNSPQMSMTGESTYEAHFVSPDCGALAPGKTEILH